MRPNLRIVAALAATSTIAVGLALASPAAAQKGVLGIGAAPGEGVVDADAGLRYTAVPTAGGTTIAALSTDGGRVERWTSTDGRLAVPAVAYDGSAGGLSASGDTLVLSQPGLRFPQLRSEFAVFDTNRLRATQRVRLKGTFTYDALSPSGRTLYLIEYTSPRDLTEYHVRAYDLERDRLEPEPIVDPRESAEEMYGTAITRETSPDGRWAYTLYDGSEYPFIHALDTRRGAAACIDLDLLEGVRNLYRYALKPSPDGAELGLIRRGGGDGEEAEPVAGVDLATLEVSAVTPVPAPIGGGDPAWPAWLAIAFGAALVIGAAVALRARRRRGRDAGGLVADG